MSRYHRSVTKMGLYYSLFQEHHQLKAVYYRQLANTQPSVLGYRFF